MKPRAFVATVANHQLTDKIVYTRVHQAIGTLAYMSPEQAELSGLDIDTRADTYGLGVLLYELPTGGTPFYKRRLEEAAVHEACRIIREEAPPKASTKLSSLGETATAISTHRRTDPVKLRQLEATRSVYCLYWIKTLVLRQIASGCTGLRRIAKGG